MQGTLTFHPIDLSFFDELVQPLLAGDKVNPERYLETGIRLHRAASECARYQRALECALESLEPATAPPGSRLWDRVRTRLERFDFRPDPVAVLVAESVEPELHLHGRPFLIAEGSADRVAAIVDEYCATRDRSAVEALVREQLVRLNARLCQQLEPVADGSSADLVVRRELLDELKSLHDIARAAERGDGWGPAGSAREPARDVMARDVPWRAVVAASRAVPFWSARDVDGLETICRAAEVEPPPFLISAGRLFGEACARFPQLGTSLAVEISGPRQVGAFVAPDDVPLLSDFLGTEGSRIIQAATRAGEGAACTTLLRKIRECLRYAEHHGMGYLEASGIPPLATLDD